MKTATLLVLVIVGLLVVVSAGPGEASVRWRGGVYIGVGPWWGHPYWGPYPYWWYPPPYYPPTVVVEPPPVYIEQPPPSPPAYWYYCMSAKAYYPSVSSCPEDWIKVPARP